MKRFLFFASETSPHVKMIVHVVKSKIFVCLVFDFL